MSIAEVVAEAVEEELSLGGDPKSVASYVLGTLTDNRYAVVELPNPDHVAEHPGEVDAAWSTYPDGDPANDARWPGPYRVAVDGDEIELGGNNLLPDEARALAAALLAAAEMATAAEVVS